MMAKLTSSISFFSRSAKKTNRLQTGRALSDRNELYHTHFQKVQLSLDKIDVNVPKKSMQFQDVKGLPEMYSTQ